MSSEDADPTRTVVIGPPGAGKTTFINGFSSAVGRVHDLTVGMQPSEITAACIDDIARGDDLCIESRGDQAALEALASTAMQYNYRLHVVVVGVESAVDSALRLQAARRPTGDFASIARQHTSALEAGARLAAMADRVDLIENSSRAMHPLISISNKSAIVLGPLPVWASPHFDDLAKGAGLSVPVPPAPVGNHRIARPRSPSPSV